ncbi:MAG: hypothetical protein GY769_20165 [bacterium]|nr:hypothetical protein [bacterium]
MKTTNQIRYHLFDGDANHVNAWPLTPEGYAEAIQETKRWALTAIDNMLEEVKKGYLKSDDIREADTAYFLGVGDEDHAVIFLCATAPMGNLKLTPVTRKCAGIRGGYVLGGEL